MGEAIISRGSKSTVTNIVQTTGNSTADVMSQKASTDNFAFTNHSHTMGDINSGVLPISQGGTNASDALNALINLGITDVNTMDFTASSQANWLSQVQAYALSNIPNRKPFVFNAGYQGTGYGTAIAWSTSDLKFLFLYNETCGIRFFKHINDTWSEQTLAVSSGGTGTSNFYEKGSWTPIIGSTGSSAPSVSYEYRYGTYYRVGNLVYVSCHLKMNINNVGSNYACIKGLPYTCGGNCDKYGLSLIEEFYATSSGEGDPRGTVIVGTSRIDLRGHSGAVVTNWVTGSGQYIGYSGCYIKS